MQAVKNKWYEWALITIPYALIFVGAVLGGLIGGLFAGLFFAAAAIANQKILRITTINTALRVLICTAIIAVAALAWWLLYWEVVALIFL